MGPITTGGDLKVNQANIRRLPKKKATTKTKKTKATKATDDDAPRPAVGTLTRTKSLLLAALRVWELKQGIRE